MLLRSTSNTQPKRLKPLKRSDPRYKPKLRGTAGAKPEVFGHALSMKDQHIWAHRHAPHLEEHASTEAFLAILRRVPKPVVYSMVLHPSLKVPVACVVIGSNKDEKMLAKSEDEELINKFMDVLGTQRRPRWFRIRS